MLFPIPVLLLVSLEAALTDILPCDYTKSAPFKVTDVLPSPLLKKRVVLKPHLS